MKKNYYLRASVLLLLIRLFFTMPVQAKWIITGSNDTDSSQVTPPTSNKTKVAYIQGDDDENGFSSVEAALAAATKLGGKQKVVVCASSTIEQDCVISQDVELRIPYSDSELDFKNPTDTGIADCGSSAVSGSGKYNVQLNANRQVYGSLTIMGQYGGSSGQFTSHSYNQYSKRTLGSKSTITVGNGGAIRCFGLIQENRTGLTNYLNGNGSKIVVKPGGSLWEPLTIYDWPGGSQASKLAVKLRGAKNPVFPFQKFDRPNIYPPIHVENGGVLYGQIQITTSIGNVNKQVPAIGPSGALINQSTGTIIWDFGRNSSNQSRTNSITNHLTKITTEGTGSLGSISVTLSIATIDSADYSIPMGPQFQVNVKSGNFTVGNKSYWYGGNNLRIEKDGRVSLTADTAVFDDTAIVNNGILSISGAFGGRVYTEVKESTLVVGNKNSITAYFLENNAAAQKTFNARGYLSASSTSESQLSTSSIYEAALRTNAQNSGYWGKNDNLYLIRYNLNEHVSVSGDVQMEMGAQMATKIRDGNQKITVVDPNRDGQRVRSYTSTKIIGEGEDAKTETEIHTGYANYQGWNTALYGNGSSVTPGQEYIVSDLANNYCKSHLMRLYDVWKGGNVTIKYDRSDDFWGSMSNGSGFLCHSYQISKNGFTPWKPLRKPFDHWELSSSVLESAQSYSEQTWIFLDENIVDVLSSNPTITFKAIAK